MKMKEFCDKTKQCKETARYYEQIGLLNPDRTKFAREFTSIDLERIYPIQKLKDLGFSLAEIKYWIDLDNKMPDMASIQTMEISDYEWVQSFVDDKISQLEERLATTQEMIQSLRKIQSRLASLDSSQFKDRKGVRHE